MEIVETTLQYCSAACNATPNCFTWLSDSSILYGAHNSLIEHRFKGDDPEEAAFNVHFDHTGVITSVSSSNGAIFTTSRDGTCLLRDGELRVSFVSDASPSCGDILKTVGSDIWVCTGAEDDKVSVWKLEKGDFKLVSSISNGRQTPLCVRLFSLTDTCLSLLIGWTSNDVQMLNLVNDEFANVCKLIGHENWVRGIDVRSIKSEALIATCGQDGLVRVWKVSPDSESNTEELQLKKITFDVNGTSYKVELDTVLEGHSGWVYSVNWHPSSMKLLSASIDKSMIVWEYSEEHRVWLDKVRVGGVGGNNLGFFGAKWSPEGDQFLGSGFHGSFHLWENKAEAVDKWVPGIVPGGHFMAVKDISWSPKGSYLLSCSSDQTTRLHGRWGDSWRELARPQIHGHDLACISCLSEVSFVSGAEEKVLRAFQATKNFAENFKRITQHDLVPERFLKTLPEGASVAALGLSNKAVFDEDLRLQQVAPDGDHSKDNQEDFYFRPTELNAPPVEETLAQNTLWNEIHKLYGHGYELYTIATSPDGSIIASACKAQSEKHASVILWDAEDWKITQKLEHHKLTVAKIAFNAEGSRILTVSRDRTWALWERSGLRYEKVARVDKTCSVHKRIIWSCAFGPPNTDLFVTVSRDKKVVVWIKTDRPHPMLNGWEAKLEIDVEEAATAVACSSYIADNSFIVAIGLENGIVDVRRLVVDEGKVTIKCSKSIKLHNASVANIEFCPLAVADGELLASCSDDCTVKITKISFKLS